MTRSVAELHATYIYDKEKRWWPYPESLDQAAATANELHLQEDSLAYLESLETEDFNRAQVVRRALMYLPPEVVIENFGEKVVAWTVVNTLIQGEADNFKTALQDHAGYNIEDFDVARNWDWQHGRMQAGSTTNVLAQYALMRGLKKDLVGDVDLEAALISSAAEGVELTKQRLGYYALTPIETDDYNTYYSGGHVKDWSRDVSSTLAYNMWLDTPSGFALTYKGLPNAMAGLAMTGADEVMLHQMQGVRGRLVDASKSKYDESRYIGHVNSRGLFPLDWTHAVAAITEQIGKNMGLQSSSIQAAKNNVWIKKRMPRDTEPHLPIEAARRIYDVNAVRLGYKRIDSDDRGNWHKSLRPDY